MARLLCGRRYAGRRARPQTRTVVGQSTDRNRHLCCSATVVFNVVVVCARVIPCVVPLISIQVHVLSHSRCQLVASSAAPPAAAACLGINVGEAGLAQLSLDVVAVLSGSNDALASLPLCTANRSATGGAAGRLGAQSRPASAFSGSSGHATTPHRRTARQHSALSGGAHSPLHRDAGRQSGTARIAKDIRCGEEADDDRDAQDPGEDGEENPTAVRNPINQLRRLPGFLR
mmetsp:Transcript_130654/g.377951  ORF Transcript_130654/g.377951 Transcript_130654/m.377951 type:complete len:231 (-) Transcript_130654:557-1249(-)